jgi:single-strand DNA-binding protein
MSQENQITLRGYLTAEPKFFQKSPQATPLTEIRVGCTPRRLNRETGEWQEQPTSYFKVRCWRRLAINTASSLHKGDQVVIRGHFYMSNWVDNQQRPRSTLEIEADTIGHDLAYGWSHFLRGTRPTGSKEDVNSGEMARQDTGTPGSEAPGSEAPGSEAPGSEAPGSEAPGSEAQVSEAQRSGDGGDEYVPDLEASGPGEPSDAQPGWDASDREPADGGGTRSVTSDAGSLAEDVNPLEREAVPF